MNWKYDFKRWETPWLQKIDDCRFFDFFDTPNDYVRDEEGEVCYYGPNFFFNKSLAIVGNYAVRDGSYNSSTGVSENPDTPFGYPEIGDIQMVTVDRIPKTLESYGGSLTFVIPVGGMTALTEKLRQRNKFNHETYFSEKIPAWMRRTLGKEIYQFAKKWYSDLPRWEVVSSERRETTEVLILSPQDLLRTISPVTAKIVKEKVLDELMLV
jgi:hypothetical protein